MVPVLIALVCAVSMASAETMGVGDVFHIPCPFFQCYDTQECPSGQYEQLYMLYRGTNCPTCRKCKDIPNHKPSRQVMDFDNGFRCPMYECHHCTMPGIIIKRGFFYNQGHKCPGCPVCYPVSSRSLRTVKDHGVICPEPICTPVFKCLSEVVTSYFMVMGKECKGCTTCSKNIV